MRTTIRNEAQAWAMLAALGVPNIELLRTMTHDELRDVAKLLLWLADNAKEPKS